MSNYKKLLIPAIILVVLVGAWLLVTNLPQTEEETPEPNKDTIQIFDFTKADLTDIEIEGKQGRLHFQYVTIQVEEEKTNENGETVTETVDRNVWQALEPEGMKVNTSAVDSLAWNANTLIAQKLIEENPEDLSVYGLDAPTKLTFTMKDGTRHILHVGNETPTGGAYYAKKETEPSVYTIGSYEGEKFLQSKFDLMMKELYDKTYALEDVTAIRFSRNGEKLFDAKQKEAAVWWLSYPIDAEARYENIATIATALAGSTISEFVEENVSDPAQYGLDDPAYVFEYVMGGNDYKLALGKRTSTGTLYAMLNDNGTVFTAEGSAYTFLDKPIEEIVSSFIHLQNINEVSELRVTFDGRTDISKIDVNTEDDELSTYDFNGTVLSGEEDEDYISTFKKYYQGAIGLLVNKIVLNEQPVLENPEVTLEYTLKTGEEIKVELVSTPDGISFYAFKNGQYTGMTLRKIQLDNEYNNGLRVSRQKLDDALMEREANQ